MHCVHCLHYLPDFQQIWTFDFPKKVGENITKFSSKFCVHYSTAKILNIGQDLAKLLPTK